ncbi:MAG: metal ABC transporter substrate-binding protein [Thermoleophilia bacterium]|nr:metal ABC transporter substrate-binding protein [Thermoleophilia bacterium]
MSCSTWSGLRRARARSARWVVAILLLLALLSVSACSKQAGAQEGGQLLVATDLSFLADIVKNVAGEMATVQAVIPEEVDPHAFQATPKDARLLSEANLVVINVRGLEPSLDELIDNVVVDRARLVEAAEGIPGRSEDPHVWLDPLNIVTYTGNIAEALSKLVPARASVFHRLEAQYNEQLQELDAWIRKEIASIPPSRRLLVTNHESLGYFAKRYGFTIIGAVFNTVSGEGSPSPRQLSGLVEAIRQTGAPAIFVEAGDNLQVAQQVADEAGVKLITDLRVHSLGGAAKTYLDMMRWNVTRIVEALR